MYVYKDKDGQVLLINVNPSGNSHRSTKEANIHIDDETTAYEKKLVEARKQLAEQHLKNMQTNRGRLRERAKSYAKALANDILR